MLNTLVRMIILAICAPLVACGGESAEFYAAEAEFEAAKAEWQIAHAKNDLRGEWVAFKKEQAALRKELEVCRLCSDSVKHSPEVQRVLNAKKPGD